MAEALKAEFPTRRIATRLAPKIALRVLGLFDASIRGIIPALGRNDQFSTRKVNDMLGLTLAPSRNALLKCAHYLVDRKLV
jgi:dihydroflavonol-4-reductase